jgi:superfamily II DNA or RNA helicase
MREQEEAQNPTVLQVVTEQSKRVLATYRVDPGLIQEHANGERRITQGGYGDRQIYELVQNGVDEMRGDAGGEVSVVLTSAHLYCANEGAPVTPEGADTILRMSVSRKRGGQIGRFGVGVKSVLSVSDTPQFFSRVNGVVFGFGFDREWSADQIRAVHPEADETPVLRMALPLDPKRARAADPVLDELLEWATTVVRLPLKPESIKRLGKDIAAFPVEFPLFSPHVGTVTLDDRRSDRVVRRQIFQLVDDDARVLQEVRPDGVSLDHNWRVFTRTHRPSATALKAAGELHDRPEVDISWAVPKRARERGLFWAYFPTNYATTLRGILNAPWKTSEDRQNLFDGNEFNEELIQVAAELVVDSLPKLASDEDPGAYIDLLPGRGKEAPQWADGRLTAAIWARAAKRPSLPDQTGTLRAPNAVKLHPEHLNDRWLALWSGYPGRPTNWCHHSVERRERRARANRIFDEANRPIGSVREWLEALTEDGTAEASAVAVRIAADLHRAGHPLAEDAAKARILLTEDNGLVAPVRGKVFRRSSADELSDHIMYVDQGVLANSESVHALETLGIQEADAKGRFTAIIDQGFHGYSDAQWSDLWQLARQVGVDHVVTVLRERVDDLARTVKVRTLAGDFRTLYHCLMPGAVVPGDGSRDRQIAVDVEFHDGDLPVLRRLGLMDRPMPDQDPSLDGWFADYRKWAWERYRRAHPDKTSMPQLQAMRLKGANPAGPLHFLQELSKEGRAAYLRNLPRTGQVVRWTVQHGSQSATQISIASPLIWMAHKHGCLATSRGLRPAKRSVGPGLVAYRNVLPVAELPDALASDLMLPATLAKVPSAIWTELLQEAENSVDDQFPGRVYALISEAEAEWPEDIGTRCRVGEEWATRPDGEIAVTADDEEYRTLIRERVPALLAPSMTDVEVMIERWGMLAVSDVVEKEVRYVQQGEPTLLIDEFPHLKIGHGPQVNGWSLVRCSELEEITRTPHGMRTVSLPAAVQDRMVLVFQPEDDLAALTAVDQLLKLGLGAAGRQSILDRRKRQQEDARLQEVRKAKDNEEKVLALIGEEEIRRGLPLGLVESDEAETGTAPTGRRLARLAMNAHGEGLLRHHSKDLTARFPAAPSTFSGSATSRRFVAELGLPENYAGTPVVTPPAEEEVDGPTSFPRLHDYQERLTENMLALLNCMTPGRAMLTLPTGAGKTRVAAEALIRFVRERGRINGPILWIAQSNELCEQAVQSWKFVWSKVGPGEKLTVSRLWGANSATAVTSHSQLVIATDAKLNICLEDDEYAWLRNAAVVIVDEAHGATAPSYTKILRLLGLSQAGAHSRTDRPLIGLTATPFRGRSEEETRRLIERFGATRLDDGIFGDEDPYTALQNRGVLSRVEHRELSGATISLTDDELSQMEGFGRGVLPSSAEEKLALDDERNKMLLDEIATLPSGWPVLVFATSVNHAKVLAAMLNGRGVTAASIDAYMPMPERRNKIDAFRAGRLRVITNYAVLAQGFDAPATRAVVVARPTYSPNVYTQMIGRGLRGPKNGGKETCLILDVRDNIKNFGDALAFTDFEDLWSAK